MLLGSRIDLRVVTDSAISIFSGVVYLPANPEFNLHPFTTVTLSIVLPYEKPKSCAGTFRPRFQSLVRHSGLGRSCPRG